MLLRAAAALRRSRCALAASRPASGAAAPPPLPPHYVFALPPLSPAMTGGRVVRWHAAPGTQLQPGDALCDVATDTLLERDGGGEVHAEMLLVVELHEEACLAALLHPAGGGEPARLVPVGAPLALLCEDARDVAALAAAAARGYSGGDESARAPLWQAHLAGAADASAPRGCH